MANDSSKNEVAPTLLRHLVESRGQPARVELSLVDRDASACGANFLDQSRVDRVESGFPVAPPPGNARRLSGCQLDEETDPALARHTAALAVRAGEGSRPPQTLEPLHGRRGERYPIALLIESLGFCVPAHHLRHARAICVQVEVLPPAKRVNISQNEAPD